MNIYISKLDGEWYAYACDPKHDMVYSIGRDCPKDGRWCARWNTSGVKYVATASPSRKAAYSKAKRYGTYCGEV